MDRLGFYAKTLGLQYCGNLVSKHTQTMAEFQINNEDLTGLKGKVVIITGMAARPVPTVAMLQRRKTHGGGKRLTKAFGKP